jgi:hypothetical protein
VLLVVLVAVPAALAASSTVRIEGAGFQVLPQTAVTQSAAGGTIVDTGGTSYATTSATALGATAAALNLGGLPWIMTVSGEGPYIDSIDGLAMAGDYSNWWELAVDGYASPVGAGSLTTVAGDSYLWFQNPDATYSKPAYLLVDKVTGGTAKLGFAPGQTVTVSTLAADLSKVHSQADATRFSTTAIELPSQYPAESGATLHVGSRVYSAAASPLAVTGLPSGTYAVWSEKAMDTSVYAPSQAMLINVGAKPALGAPSAGRTNATTVKVHFVLSERATVTIVVTRGAKRLARLAGSRGAGAQALTLHLSPAAPKSSTSITVKITATDSWGRTTVKTITVPKGK